MNNYFFKIDIFISKSFYYVLYIVLIFLFHFYIVSIKRILILNNYCNKYLKTMCFLTYYILYLYESL